MSSQQAEHTGPEIIAQDGSHSDALMLSAQERLQLYDHLFSGDLFGLYRASLTGRMLSCNMALARLLGYSSWAELADIPLERHYFDVVERQQFIDDLQEKKILNNYEVLLKHRSGRAVHVLENVVLREEPGRASVIEGVVIDITALRQSELEQRVLANNYRQLTERVRDGMIVLQAGRIVYANPAAEAMAGSDNLVGTQIEQFIGPEGAATLAAMLEETTRSGSSTGGRIEFGHQSGGRRPLVIHGTTTWHMNAAAVQLTLQDVELERSLIQERLRDSMAEEMSASLRQEIEQHRHTQEALEQSRRLAKSLIDSSLDMIVAVDHKGQITEFNPAATIKFGYEAEQVLGQGSRMLYADEGEFKRVQQEMDRYGAYAGEVRNRTAEGRIFTSFLAASRVVNEEGVLMGSMGVSRDVTQAKRDREALRESEERYRDLVDNANDMIHSVDAEGKFLFTNNAWRKTLGYTDEQLKKLTLFDLIVPEEDREASRHWFASDGEASGAKAWTTIYRAADGRELHIEGTSSVSKVDGKIVIARTIFRDVTESRAAAEKLQRHNAKEKALFESSDHMFWTVDRRIALTSFNKGYHDMIVRLHGKAPKLQPDPGEEKEYFAPMEYHDFWKSKYASAFAGKKMHFETDRTDMQGKQVCNEIFLSPVFNAKGEVEEVFGVGIEVTQQRQAEATVREQAAKLEAIFQSSADVMIWSVDREFQLTACNQCFVQNTESLTGHRPRPGDNVRQVYKGLVGHELDAEWVKLYTDCFAGKQMQREARISLNDGTEAWLELFMSPIRTDQGIHEISCLAHDITQKKRTEQAMMENLREKEVLLKEVHHRVKNNLQIISSIFSLQKGHVDGDERSMELLRESQDRIRSMAFIHESLYQNKNFTEVDLAAYIQELCSNLVMSYAVDDNIRIEPELQPLMLGLDKAIPCGLVLNELISNVFKHAFTVGVKGELRIVLTGDDNRIKIVLEDNGRGFPPGYDPDRDRGLGTELVEVLMDQLEGELHRSVPKNGQGTSYCITFDRS